MTIKDRFLILILFLLALIINQGCAPIKHTGVIDRYGCSEPPPDVFTLAGVDAQFAELKFGKIVTGGINIKNNPQVVSLANKASKDARIRDYLRCLAKHRDKYTNEQIAYFEQLTAFMQTEPPPTAEQFLIWQKSYPFPTSGQTLEQIQECTLYPFEKEKFKTFALGEFGRIRLNPLVRAVTARDELQDIINDIKTNPCYEKEMPLESAILYRLYGVSILFSLNDSHECIKNTHLYFPYLEKSFNLDQSVWEQPHEKSTYKFFEKIYRNPPKEVIITLADYLFYKFSIAMIGANEDEVKHQVNAYWEEIKSLMGKPKTDLEFFLDYSGKWGNYKKIIATYKRLIETKEKKFWGPSIEPMEGGNTLIKYVITFKDKQEKSIEWVVDKDSNLIEPRTESAKALHYLITNLKGNP